MVTILGVEAISVVAERDVDEVDQMEVEEFCPTLPISLQLSNLTLTNLSHAIFVIDMDIPPIYVTIVIMPLISQPILHILLQIDVKTPGQHTISHPNHQLSSKLYLILVMIR